MEDPIYHLEGVIRTKEETEDFTGPLNLILLLLSKNKIEIRDVSISALLEQYLAYLDTMAAMDMEIASEFIAMASHLMLIKTKVLLAGEQEVSELEELLSSLESLQARDVCEQIRGVTDALASMYRVGSGLLEKQPEPLPAEKTYRYVHESSLLTEALLRMLDREQIPALAPAQIRIPQRIVYSVDAKTQELVQKLREAGALPVRALFDTCSGRSEMVATLLVLLELCKNGNVLLEGAEGSMTVTFRSVPEQKEKEGEPNGTDGITQSA